MSSSTSAETIEDIRPLTVLSDMKDKQEVTDRPGQPEMLERISQEGLKKARTLLHLISKISLL